MNQKQLQYAVLLSQCANVTEAAAKLAISQPALSKQILSLERELGVSLFDRSGQPLSLTPAGEEFVSRAKEILLCQDALASVMEAYRKEEVGRLSIGISPFRASYDLAGVIASLRTRFPQLQVVLCEENSTRLQAMAADGETDLTVMNLPVDEAKLEVLPLHPEPVVLAVPERLLSLLPAAVVACGRSGELRPEDVRQMPMVVLGKTQELRRLFDGLFSTAAHPPIAAQVVGIASAWNLVEGGVGAALIPQDFAKTKMPSPKVRLFSIRGAVALRRPAIVYRKGVPLSRYAKAAVELILEKDAKSIGNALYRIRKKLADRSF